MPFIKLLRFATRALGGMLVPSALICGLLVLGNTSNSLAQYKCHITVFGTCHTDTCSKTCGGVLCGCDIQIPPKPKPTPQPKNPTGAFLSSSADSPIFQLSGNRYFYSPGNSFAGSFTTTAGATFNYDPLLGGGSDSIAASTISFEFEIIGPHSYNSNYTDVRLTSFYATTPSFHSSALGLDTGVNEATLATLEDNQGLFENATGIFTIPANLWLTNDIYTPANPGFVTIDVTGRIDLSDPLHPTAHIGGLPRVWGP